MNRHGTTRHLGIDLGAETLKLVELERTDGQFVVRRRCRLDHGKNPQPLIARLSREWDWPTFASATVTGRLSRQLNLPRVPLPQAQARAFGFLFPGETGTLVTIGSHGFSALELRPNGMEVLRENSRCSQGTGNFLRQLVERFSLTVEEASVLCSTVTKASTLSGRCPVILKTDMTHLANKGEDRAQIIAGLFDAVCDNILTLVKPGVSPGPVVLIGGVSQAPRVQRRFQDWLAQHNYELRVPGEDGLYMEALGAALIGAEQSLPVTPVEELMAGRDGAALEKLPALAAHLGRVRRLPPQPLATVNGTPRNLILGFDIGSTGAKAVALDADTTEVVWEGYRQTAGAPVEAAQALWRQFTNSPAAACPVLACGATGSGREIVGSLLATCYGRDAVLVLNEIAAHAAGACHFDRRVDTIFEIGGQDAKYIRLEDGRVIGCAMNEACSAGTGSFIEEQGRKFEGVTNVAELGTRALAAADGVSLGQHCSVFMAEIIDEAVAAGLPQDTIIAGLYDSIIQNYLNRVKGSRPVGQVIFCQGMPFSADALAAAVARQTGSEVIIPPNPGTVGALGIALLTQRQLAWTGRPALDPQRFLEASVVQKSTFACGANTGCGGNGQHCRIDRLQTQVAGQRQTFTWGGACALHDHGARRRKLPDRAPHPFREREELVAELTATLTKQESRRRVALSDEFLLKELFPFFAAYLNELGCAITVVTGGDKATLKRGIQESHVPFCAPMQMFHGVAARLRETAADFVFAPIIRGTEHVADEPCAKVCPVVQAAPFLLQHDLAKPSTTRWLTPEIEFGADGLESASFRAGCAELARAVGATPADARRAHRAAAVVQRRFRDQCLASGERALAFCRQHDLVPVVVLGRPYTIYNDTLNSNVPAILREQGAMAIPVDCYPVTGSAPTLDRVYWGYAQRILRAARQVRQSPGVYSVYCSNYSCGPDSFNLHFYSYVMEGKPLAIIETDGHAGDAGTKTRIEAFLHCVEQDRAANRPRPTTRDLHQLAASTCGFDAIDRQHETLLVPWMGVSSEIGAACLRAAGFQAQALAVPDREALRLGRRHSSGKECLPFSLTLGRLLEFMEQHPQTRCVHMMPSTNGPCRLGMYSLVQQTVVERLGLGDRCRFVSPHETNYYAGLPPGFTTLFYAGIIASVLLQDSLLAVRPAERRPGAANEIFARRHAELCSLLERQSRIITSTTATVAEVMAGRLFGVPALLEEAAREWQAVQGAGGHPVVLLVGEIYVRNDGFANDNIVERLEARGLQVRCTPFNEFLDYVDHCNQQASRPSFGNLVTQQVKQRVHRRLHQAIARHLTLPPAAHIEDTIAAAGDYLRGDIGGEAVITLGLALHEWRRKAVAAVVNVGPLECMPTRIAEAQFFHIAEREGLPSLTLAYNGDPISDDALDNFAFAVVERHSQSPASPVGPLSKRDRLVRGDGSRFQTAPTTTP